MYKTHRILPSIIDGFFLMRPVILIPVWGFALFGFYKGRNGSIADLPQLWRHTTSTPFLWILIFSISVGSVYVLNQIADIEVDKKNGGLPLLASGILSIRYSWVIAIMTAIFSIAIPACFGKLTITLLSLATIIVGIFYSFRPMFFSGRIFLDFFTNALGFGIIAFGAGWSLAGREFFPFSLFVKAALPYFLLMCAGSISSTIPDISGDREGHKFTTAVVLGEQKAHLVAFLFVAAASIDAVMVNDVIASICAIAALPFYFLHSLWPKQVFAEATYKVGGALCMIAAGCITPLFFPCALAVFLLTWMYFRFRHGVIYPSLTPAPNAAPSTGKK